jgi:hypothetical protein
MTRETYYGAPAHLRRMSASAADSLERVAASQAQARCDAVQAEFRSAQANGQPPERRSLRRDPPPLPRALVPTDDILRQRLAEELEYARRLIEQMGDALSCDPTIVGRHMISLQAVDIVGQMMGHIANVVRSSDPDGAVDRIGMSDLKGRLQRKPAI